MKQVKTLLLGAALATAFWSGWQARGMDFGSMLLSALNGLTSALEASEIPHQKGGLFQ